MKRVDLIKNILPAMLVGALAIATMSGCAKKEADEQVAIEDMQGEKTEATEETDAEDADNQVKTSIDSEKSETSASTAEIPDCLVGTWQRSSIGYEYNGELQPEYYVQFTAETVDYGHMKDGSFAIEYSDKIHSVEKVENGGVKVQAENSEGKQYTYQTAEGDKTVLEYYSTWDENDFANAYSGGSSLSIAE
ncbi:MAG: hypothetical protein J5802_09190 [Butyrivibrio sp.]|nr:hypothetical protein [Butyrivibrio sp.]